MRANSAVKRAWSSVEPMRKKGRGRAPVRLSIGRLVTPYPNGRGFPGGPLGTTSMGHRLGLAGHLPHPPQGQLEGALDGKGEPLRRRHRNVHREVTTRERAHAELSDDGRASVIGAPIPMTLSRQQVYEGSTCPIHRLEIQAHTATAPRRKEP